MSLLPIARKQEPRKTRPSFARWGPVGMIGCNSSILLASASEIPYVITASHWRSSLPERYVSMPVEDKSGAPRPLKNHHRIRISVERSH